MSIFEETERSVSTERGAENIDTKFSEAAARRVKPLMGCQLQQVFGMAEGLVNYTRLDDDLETVVTTQGRPMCVYDQIMIVDDEDQPVEFGKEGHLLTKGPYTICAYFEGKKVGCCVHGMPTFPHWHRLYVEQVT